MCAPRALGPSAFSGRTRLCQRGQQTSYLLAEGRREQGLTVPAAKAWATPHSQNACPQEKLKGEGEELALTSPISQEGPGKVTGNGQDYKFCTPDEHGGFRAQFIPREILSFYLSQLKCPSAPASGPRHLEGPLVGLEADVLGLPRVWFSVLTLGTWVEHTPSWAHRPLRGRKGPA